ncbi:MAG TPA: hypothetical protein VL614_04970 [Acetobacteraceae bacterium]|jgi:hypothetical protein|nr:hypothetical protein [Acetobacteraceae bacterium]
MRTPAAWSSLEPPSERRLDARQAPISVHLHFLTHGERVLTVQLERDLATRLSRGLASVLEQMALTFARSVP